MKDHIEQQREELPVGAWPVIAEEKCFDLVSDILKGLAFLNSKGLVHGDIKGNSFAAGYDYFYRLFFCLFAAIYVLTRFLWQREPCSVAQPKREWFQKISDNFEVVEEFDMLYSNPPEIS